jgi:FtsH-binding integral membrane protein
MMFSNRASWFIVLALFMGATWVANSMAQSSTSAGTQYAGLALYIVAEAVIFLPLLYIANNFADGTVIPTAGLITLLLFGGLTAIVFMTGSDFSFLRTGLTIAGLAALGLILCAGLFGFNLGTLFTVAMIALMCGYILYDTSNVLHHYRIGQHVAASLALFATVATLFWYVLQLVMSLNRR